MSFIVVTETSGQRQIHKVPLSPTTTVLIGRAWQNDVILTNWLGGNTAAAYAGNSDRGQIGCKYGQWRRCTDEIRSNRASKAEGIGFKAGPAGTTFTTIPASVGVLARSTQPTANVYITSTDKRGCDEAHSTTAAATSAISR